MKHLKYFKLYESVYFPLSPNTISKTRLVDMIKWYSNYLNRYMIDVNKYTNANLNFSFSYNTELTISQIFETVNELNHESPDGFITAICNEFIKWSEYMTNAEGRIASDLVEFRIDKGYDNFTEEYKEKYKSNLYGNQNTLKLIYAAVGRDIKNLIDDTIWDIPLKKEFTREDNEFIIDSILSDIDIDGGYLKQSHLRSDGGTMKLYNNTESFKFGYKSIPGKRGIVIKMPCIGGIMTYDSDFMKRIQSYFSGALLLDKGFFGGSIKIYLPFYY